MAFKDDFINSLEIELKKDNRGLKPNDIKHRTLKRSSIGYDSDTDDKLDELCSIAREATGRRPSVSQVFSALVNAALPNKKSASKAKPKSKSKSRPKDLAAGIKKLAG